MTPCIIVPGIGQSKVDLIDAGGKKIKSAWPVEADPDEVMKKLKAPLMKLMLFRKDKGFSEAVAEILTEILEPLSFNSAGVPKKLLRVVSYPESVAKCSENEKKFIYGCVPMQSLAAIIGEENLYYFAYNPFGDPFENADLLNEFIEHVKNETESERVNLVPVSLGAVVSVAYLSIYAAKKDIHRVMYFVAALDGSELLADIAEKKIVPEKASSLVRLLTSEKTARELGGIASMLPEGVSRAVLMKALDALDAVLLNSPMMWAAVPSSRYDILAERFLSDKKALKEKTDRYFEASRDFPSAAARLANEGAEFFAVCGYGLPLLAVSRSDTISSDGIISVSSSSGGALSAPLGHKLRENGGEEGNGYLSPDGTLDASGGLWPDTTWYFYAQRHDEIACNDKALKIAASVLSDDDFKNIYSSPALPQFGQAQDNRK